MLNRFDLELDQALERRRDDLAFADHERLIAACEQPGGLVRRAARPLGRVLSNLGAQLLSYADTRRSSAALPAYHRSSRSIELR